VKRIKNVFDQVGRTGLQQYGGYIYEDWFPPLVGAAGARIYRMMGDNSPVLYGMRYAVDMILSKVPVKVTEASSCRADREAKAFVDSLFKDMNPSWPETKSEILTDIVFGWAYFEQLFKKREGLDQADPLRYSQYDDGLIGWRSWEIRSQESLDHWVFDEETGELLGLVQSPPPDFQPRFVPYAKSLLFRIRSSKNNPEGESLFRGCYRAWYNVTNAEDIEGIGMERDLCGLPVLYAPEKVVSGKDAKSRLAKQKCIKLITGLKRDESEGVLLPSTRDKYGNREYELTLLASAGTRQFNINQTITRYTRDMAMTLLADFLLLGSQKYGSNALAVTKNELFQAALQTICDRMAGVINSQAIPLVISLNPFDDITGLPKVSFGTVETPDLAQLGEFISNLAGSKQNLFADDVELENYLRRAAGLPSAPPKPNPLPTSLPNSLPAGGQAQAQTQTQPGPEAQPQDDQAQAMDELQKAFDTGHYSAKEIQDLAHLLIRRPDGRLMA